MKTLKSIFKGSSHCVDKNECKGCKESSDDNKDEISDSKPSSNIIVIYKSKQGSTERYAKWIAEETGANLHEGSKITLDKILKYDTIIFGGGLYAGGILGISIIKNNYNKLKDKRILVFSVGASPAHPEVLEDVKNKNFTNEMKEKISYIHFRGGFDFSKLGSFDKLLMLLLKKKLKGKKKEELTNDEKGMLACYDHPADWTNKSAITPILDYIKGNKS